MAQINATLIRYLKTNAQTLGILLIGDDRLYTLEPPWLDNRPNVSCIPPGEYEAKWLKQSASGKYKNVFHLTSVDQRTGILIHNGNIVDHTKGCILVGTRSGILLNQPAVLSSRTAMRKLQKYKDSFILRIL